MPNAKPEPCLGTEATEAEEGTKCRLGTLCCGHPRLISEFLVHPERTSKSGAWRKDKETLPLIEFEGVQGDGMLSEEHRDSAGGAIADT